MKNIFVFLSLLIALCGCQQQQPIAQQAEKLSNAAIIRLCHENYKVINREVFNDKLPEVAILIVEDPEKLPVVKNTEKHRICGVFESKFKIIYISLPKVHTREQIRKTIYHEACHVAQYYLIYPEFAKKLKHDTLAQTSIDKIKIFDPLTSSWYNKKSVSEGHGSAFRAIMNKVNAHYTDVPVTVHCNSKKHKH